MTTNNNTNNSGQPSTTQTSFKIKKKIKSHPNEIKYPGLECAEVKEAFFQLLLTLESEEAHKLIEGKAVIEPEKTAEYFDSLKAGDVFGCAVYMNPTEERPFSQWVLSRYKIDSIGNDILRCTDVSERAWKGKEVNVYFEDVSFSLTSGLTEILYRDGKPYGIDEEQEITVNVVTPEKNES